jgi:hypothetical protein
MIRQVAPGSIISADGFADWCPPFSGYHLYYPGRRLHAPAFSLLFDTGSARPSGSILARARFLELASLDRRPPVDRKPAA